MADRIDAQDLTDDAPEPPKSNRNLIIMGVMTAAWVGGAAGMYFAMKQNGAQHAKAAAGEGEHGGGEHEGAAEHEGGEEGGGGEGGHDQSVITMPSFIANLTPEVEGDMHYLKCTLAVALTSPSGEKILEARTPKLRNQILVYLSGLKMSDIEGSENKRKLVTHLVELTNTVMGGHKVEDVYLTEFVVQ